MLHIITCICICFMDVCHGVGLEMLLTECLVVIRLLYEHDGMCREGNEWSEGHWVVRRELSGEEGTMCSGGGREDRRASSSLKRCWTYDCLVPFMHYKRVCFNNIFTLSLLYNKLQHIGKPFLFNLRSWQCLGITFKTQTWASNTITETMQPSINCPLQMSVVWVLHVSVPEKTVPCVKMPSLQINFGQQKRESS